MKKLHTKVLSSNQNSPRLFVSTDKEAFKRLVVQVGCYRINCVEKNCSCCAVITSFVVCMDKINLMLSDV